MRLKTSSCRFIPGRSKLADTIEPTLEKLNVVSERAAQLWPQRIWKMALTAGVIVGLSVAILGIGAVYGADEISL